jgi:hypothetical protein
MRLIKLLTHATAPALRTMPGGGCGWMHGHAAGPSGGIRLSDGNSLAWRRAQIPAASGFGNARSVAAVQSVLASGGTARGVRLLSPAGCDLARQEQYRGVDQILGAAMRYGMGYGIFDRSCGWGGWAARS